MDYVLSELILTTQHIRDDLDAEANSRVPPSPPRPEPLSRLTINGIRLKKLEHQLAAQPKQFGYHLPIFGGSDERPLHIKTGWKNITDNENIMYHLKFEGYHFVVAYPIHFVAVGYLYQKHGHCYNNIVNMVPGTNIISQASLQTYISSDGYLVFLLSSLNGKWHASSLTVSFILGHSVYLKRGHETFEITQVVHQSDKL